MRLVFDLESNGLYEKADKIWCICTKDIDTKETFEWTIESGDYLPNFLDWLDSASELLGHNIINYDLPVLKKLTGWEPRKNVKITDTLVMSRLFNPDRPKPSNPACKGGSHSLEAWGYRVGKGKPDHNEWHIFSPAMLRRCREDVEINDLVYSALEREALGHDWEEALSLEQETSRIMTTQSHRGICFDVTQAIGYVQELGQRIKEIDDYLIPNLPMEIKQIGTTVTNPFLKTGGYRKQTQDYLNESYKESGWGCVLDRSKLVGGPFTRIRFEPFKLGSTVQVKDYLLSSGWVPESWNFSVKTGERTSPKLEGSFRGVDGELPRKIKERITWRHRRSQIEGWLKGVRSDDSLPAGANPCGTNTGRMRHSVVVNVPKANADKQGALIWNVDEQSDIYGTQMRSLFIPREGYKLVGHDAAGLELRMLAHYMDDPEFTREILEGDIHTFNQLKAGLPNRNDAKTFIYAFLYGAGDAKIGSIIDGDSAAGKQIKSEFLDSLPSLARLIKSVKKASKRGWLKGLDGRKVWMRRDSTGGLQTSKALNTLLQSAGAVVMKKSCEILWKSCEEAGLRAYKVLDMHDEGQAEIELAVDSIVKAGEYFKLNIPLAADAKVGLNMAETH
jgi:DNA polymerase I-like protein with 3'-5' exonuclease and polymerase domains